MRNPQGCDAIGDPPAGTDASLESLSRGTSRGELRRRLPRPPAEPITTGIRRTGIRLAVVDHAADLAQELERHCRGIRITRLAPGDTVLPSLRTVQPNVVLLGRSLRPPEAARLGSAIRFDPRLPLSRVIVMVRDWSPDDVRRVRHAVHAVTVSVSPKDVLRDVFATTRPGGTVVMRREVDAALIKEEVAADQIDVGRLRLIAHSCVVAIDGVEVRLTAGEFELLWTLACRAGRLVTNDEISRLRSWSKRDASDQAVRGRIAALRRRLGPAAKQIKNVRGNGYRLTP
jgi:DNA-binding response OmpR family regulator